MSQVTLLQDLQAIDSEVEAGKVRLAKVLADLKADGTVVEARQSAETAQTHWRKWQTRQKDKQLELDGANAKRKQSHDRLYSGKVKSAKELLDLQNEVDALARRIAALEDEMIEILVMVEEAEEARDSAETTLSQLETEWSTQTETLNSEKQQLALKLNQLLTQRQQHITRIDKRNLTLYERIRKAKRGVAVVPLQQYNHCSGCRLSLSSEKVKAIHEGRIITCTHCTRIITPPPTGI